MIYEGDLDQVLKLREEFEPKGVPGYFPFCHQRKGIRELLYYVREMLDKLDDKPVVFEQEFFPEYMMGGNEDEPYTISYDEDKQEYVVEGP